MKLSKEAQEFVESRYWVEAAKIDKDNEKELQKIFETWRVGHSPQPIIENYTEKTKKKILKIADLYYTAYKRDKQVINSEDWDELVLLINKKIDKHYEIDSAILSPDFNHKSKSYADFAFDTGSMLNILPHQVGLDLGFVWNPKKAIIPLSGTASSVVMLVKVTGTIPTLDSVELCFVWASNDNFRLILGQANFFAEYHACFYQDQRYFDISSR